MATVGLMWLLAMAVLQSLVSCALGKPCGETILGQDFSGFKGNYEHWSEGRGGCAVVCNGVDADAPTIDLFRSHTPTKA